MLSKYKFYFIGVLLLGVGAFFYFRKKKGDTDEAAETGADATTASTLANENSSEAEKSIAKSIAYVRPSYN